MAFDPRVLKIDAAAEVQRISAFVAEEARAVLRRSGVVVGLSGGVDSAVMAGIAVQAVGAANVLTLILPERESNPISREYARKQARILGVEAREVDITPTVDAVGGYAWRDEYLKSLVPEYGPGCTYHISLPTDLLERDSYNLYVLRVRLPDGSLKTKRLTPESFRTLTAFASIKIRARMMHLYWESERRGFLVAGTTNRTEQILGDFCKYGDGGTDLEPLAHLYKNQVYQLAEILKVTREIKERVPSPDTFSLPVSDQEFYFRIPFAKLDFLLLAWEHKVSTQEAADVLDLAPAAVDRAFRDFTAKSRATAHLREMPHELRRVSPAP